MDYKVVWSPEAIEDLQSVAEYIERDSEFYARAVVIKILDVSQGINHFPLRGRIVPEIEDKKIRELFVYSYRVIYQIKESQILIVAVIHDKRLFDSISERF